MNRRNFLQTALYGSAILFVSTIVSIKPKVLNFINDNIISKGRIFYVNPCFKAPIFSNMKVAQDGTDPTYPLHTIASAIDKCRPGCGETIIVFTENYS